MAKVDFGDWVLPDDELALVEAAARKLPVAWRVRCGEAKREAERATSSFVVIVETEHGAARSSRSFDYGDFGCVAAFLSDVAFRESVGALGHVVHAESMRAALGSPTTVAECKIKAPSLKPEHRQALERAAKVLSAEWVVTIQATDPSVESRFEVRVWSRHSIEIAAFDEARVSTAVHFIESFAQNKESSL